MNDELIDFYAGLAMAGLLAAGQSPAYMEDLSNAAFEVAERMMEKREERKERKVNE